MYFVTSRVGYSLQEGGTVCAASVHDIAAAGCVVASRQLYCSFGSIVDVVDMSTAVGGHGLVRRVTAVTYTHCCRVQNLLYVRGSEPTYELLLCSAFAPFTKYGVAQQQNVPEGTFARRVRSDDTGVMHQNTVQQRHRVEFRVCHRVDMVVLDGRKIQSQPPDNEASTPSRLSDGPRLAKRASRGFLTGLFRCLRNPRKSISYNVWQSICPLRTVPEGVYSYTPALGSSNMKFCGTTRALGKICPTSSTALPATRTPPYFPTGGTVRCVLRHFSIEKKKMHFRLTSRQIDYSNKTQLHKKLEWKGALAFRP